MIKENIIKVRDYISPSKIPTADYVINPYVGCTHKCAYCYADFMKRFTNHPEPWGDFIDIKVTDKKISHKKLEGKKVILSSVTDPYNPHEKKYEITREILKQLQGANIELTILTKSNLITRDIDLIKTFPNVEIAFSICTVSEKFRKDMEPGASPIYKRIDALKELHHNGIKTAIFMAPMFPGLTDYPQIIEQTKDFVDTYWFENLNLRGAYKYRILNYIYEHYPKLKPLYDDIYKKHDRTYWEILAHELNDYCIKEKVNYINYFYHEEIRKP